MTDRLFAKSQTGDVARMSTATCGYSRQSRISPRSSGLRLLQIRAAYPGFIGQLSPGKITFQYSTGNPLLSILKSPYLMDGLPSSHAHCTGERPVIAAPIIFWFGFSAQNFSIPEIFSSGLNFPQTGELWITQARTAPSMHRQMTVPCWAACIFSRIC